jgi:hypothetical protein
MLRVFASFAAAALTLSAANTTVRFEPANPDVGPFPSDALTVADNAQKTGKRVNMPLPDCTKAASTCAELGVINQLDGFNPQPRIRVTFSGPINPDTLRGGIWIIALDNLTNEEFGITQFGEPLAINQVIYDPETNSVFAKPDYFLDQHRRYAIVVSNAVYDKAGDPVTASPAYAACANATSADCAAVAEVARVATEMFGPRKIVASTIFTTMSATAWMENARAKLQTTSTGFARGTSFRLSDAKSVVWRQQTGTNPVSYTDVPLPTSLIVGVSTMAFNSFQSTRYLNDSMVIPQTPTGQDVARPATEQITFDAFLPVTPKPAAGYPVVIFGHGITSNFLESPAAAASTMAAAGLAVVGINAVGHGFGPQSKLVLTDQSGNTREIPVPGRGVATTPLGSISAGEGCIVLLPVPYAIRDCLRQTAVDLAQLTRVIRSGVDLDGDGTVDLDPSRIYYIGQSLGSLYGTLFNAIEPSVSAATLNVGGGSVADVVRWGPGFHSLAVAYLGLRQPSLLNKGADYDENYVLRYQPVKVNDVTGAIPIQEVFERISWIDANGDPLSFAPHLSSSTLPGVPIKRVLFQYGIGDQTVPNPAQTALVRAANMRETTWIYRHDLAYAAISTLPRNPHTYLLNVLTPAGLPIALAAQGQAAAFFSSYGTVIVDPNTLLPSALGQLKLFEAPSFLTEGLNFIP